MFNLRLKRENPEKLLQDYGNRARKLQGERLSLEDFAQFLNLPVSDVLRDMFALFDEVNYLAFNTSTVYVWHIPNKISFSSQLN